MKKQSIAKILVLVMALAMVPVAAMAADVGGVIARDDAVTNENYPYNPGDDTETPSESVTVPVDPTPIAPAPVKPSPDEATEASEAASEAEEPTTPATETVEKIDDVKTSTNANGDTVVTATVKAENPAAPVQVTEKALDTLVEQAKAGDAVAIAADTTGSVTVPANKVAELIEKTGNPVTMGNNVASVSVNKELVAAAGGADITVAPKQNDDGTYDVPVMAGDKEIDPEKVEGGIDVEISVNVTASQVDTVNAVKADKTTVELKWSISVGKLQVNLTVKGSVQIVRK